MKGMIKYIGIGCVALAAAACAKDKTQKPECFDSVSFQTDIMPMVEQNCSTSGCHDVSAAGGYELLTYSEVKASADIMLSAMNYETGLSPMPQGAPPMDSTIIGQFNCWIKQGTPDN